MREDSIIITAIELEDSTEYAIWVSYMEVYNEKVSAPSSNAVDAGLQMPYMYWSDYK
jgi:kinesin family protein 20